MIGVGYPYLRLVRQDEGESHDGYLGQHSLRARLRQLFILNSILPQLIFAHPSREVGALRRSVVPSPAP